MTELPTSEIRNQKVFITLRSAIKLVAEYQRCVAERDRCIAERKEANTWNARIATLKFVFDTLALPYND